MTQAEVSEAEEQDNLIEQEEEEVSSVPKSEVARINMGAPVIRAFVGNRLCTPIFVIWPVFW